MFERKIDKEVLGIVASLWERESVVGILEVLKKVARSERSRIDRAIARVEEGEGFVSSLQNEKLISKDLSEYLISAENSKVMQMFAKEKLAVDKKLSEIKKDLITNMISPTLALLITLGVIYVFIYKVIPGFNLSEKHFALLPSYFPALVMMSKSITIYLGLILSVFTIIFLIYFFRKSLPFISDIYLLYERVKLYSMLYLSIKAGYNLDEALRRYKGDLKDMVDKVLRLLDEGVYITDAFLQSMKGITPTEEVLSRIALSVASNDTMRDLYEESFNLLKTKLEATKQVFTLTSLIITASVILFAYMGILIPIIRAVRNLSI